LIELRVRVLLETRQRGVYATTLLMYEFLKEIRYRRGDVHFFSLQL